MNKYILHIAAIGLVSTAAMSSCSGSDKKEAKDSKEAVPVVKVETVNSRIIDQNGNYTATVEPELINNISSSMPNRIKAIYVDEGQRVSAG